MRGKMYFYDDFASQFDKKMNMHETNKRLHLIFNDLLRNEDLVGKTYLDAGSGTGWFSKMAVERGAIVTSLDVGENILAQVAKKCDSTRVVGSVLELPFPDNSFDLVVSTEVIEHTPNPRQGVAELCRVVKPGGILIITVPNRFWKWSCELANWLKLRPYEGYENWVGYGQLRQWVHQYGDYAIQRHFGFNIIPVYFKFTYPLIDAMDRFGRSLGSVMVNIALMARKHP